MATNACILSFAEAELLEKHGVKPNCRSRSHKHCAKDEADYYLHTGEAKRVAKWIPGPFRVRWATGMTFRKVYTDPVTGRPHSCKLMPGIPVMQLVKGG